MARRSFSPTDIHWGRQFCDIIIKPDTTLGGTQYSVDLERFDLVEPQHGLPLLPPSQLSALIVNRAKVRAVNACAAHTHTADGAL